MKHLRLCISFVTLAATGFAAELHKDVTLTGTLDASAITNKTTVLSDLGAAPLSRAWSSSATYAAGQRALGSDGNGYRAIAASANADPTADDGTHWQIESVDNSVSLAVPSRFATFTAAWAFLASAKIDAGATATIQFADGAYSMGSSGFVLNHPFGPQIRILGNTTTPASCVLNFALPSHGTTGFLHKDWGAFCISDGHAIGLIDGFTMSTSPANQYGAVGMEVFSGSVLICGPHLVLHDFYAGLFCTDHSYLAADGATVTGGGDGNLFAYQGSVISFLGGTSTGANTWFGQSGAMIEFDSALFAANATFTGNGLAAVIANTGSSVNLDGATVSGRVGTNQGVGFFETAGMTAAFGTQQQYLGWESGHLMVGQIDASTTPDALMHLVGTRNTTSDFLIVQDGVCGLYLGSDGGSSTNYVTSDGPILSLRVSSTPFLAHTISGGTEGLHVDATRTTLPTLLSLTPRTAPGAPIEGDVYAGTDHHLYYYNGSAWKQLDN